MCNDEDAASMVDLLQKMLVLSPGSRLSAEQALVSPALSGTVLVPANYNLRQGAVVSLNGLTMSAILDESMARASSRLDRLIVRTDGGGGWD